MSADSALAVSMMMLVFAVCGFFRSRCATSNPSMRGIITSSRTRSGRSVVAPREGLLAVGGHRDVVAGRAEVDLDEPRDVRIVVDNEDRLGHRATLLPRWPRGSRAASAGSGWAKIPDAAISTVAPASIARCALSILTPPSISSATSSPADRSRLASPRAARTPPGAAAGRTTRADAHQHHVVDGAQVRETRLDRRLEVQRQAHAKPRAARLRDRRPGLGHRLQVEADDVETGVVQLVEESLGRIDHQMTVQRPRRHRSQTLHDHRAQSDRRHEMPVHDVDMEHPDVRFHGGNLRPKRAKSAARMEAATVPMWPSSYRESPRT